MSVQLYFVQLKFCLIYTKLYSFMSGTFELHITDGNTEEFVNTEQDVFTFLNKTLPDINRM